MLALFVSRLTFLSILVALFPLVKNVLYFLNFDHFLEECNGNILVNKNHTFVHYPCFYLELWLEYNNGVVYDTRRFLDIFCTITIIFTALYVITSGIAIYGIVNDKTCTFIPWISANVTISLFMSLLLSTELYLHVDGKFHPSSYFFITLFSTFYVTFNWIVGVILIIKIQRYPKQADNESSQITYVELQNLINEDFAEY